MSATVKENILYVGLILVVSFLAVFPMLFECFFASRRRSLEEAAFDSRRERIRSILKDFSMEITAEMFSFLSDCVPNGEYCGKAKEELSSISPAHNAPLDESSVRSKVASITSQNSLRLLIPQAGYTSQGLNFKKDSMKALQPLCICSALKPKSQDDNFNLIQTGEEISSITKICCNKLVSDEEATQHHEPTCCLRSIDTSCCICLEPYKVTDIICWSSNPACCHVFHQNCIINWFVSSTNAANQGTVADIRDVIVTPRRDQFERDAENYSDMETIPAHDAISQHIHRDRELPAVNVDDFTCPCCRALFI